MRAVLLCSKILKNFLKISLKNRKKRLDKAKNRGIISVKVKTFTPKQKTMRILLKFCVERLLEMGKNLEVTLLLDFYGDMLTEKQKDVIDLYYNQDLSLAEIADEVGISRQGVRDSIKRGEAVLFEMEGRLGFLRNYRASEKAAEKIAALAKDIIEINRKQSSVGLIEVKANDILKEIEALRQE